MQEANVMLVILLVELSSILCTGFIPAQHQPSEVNQQFEVVARVF